MNRPIPIHNRGFTLIEMAIVMVILGFIIAGLMSPLGSLRDTSDRNATDDLINEVYEALLGYATRRGRLPCPAWTSTNGAEDRDAGTDNCNREHGYVPVATLGLNGNVDDNNLLIDAWLRPIRYSISNSNNWEYAKAISLSPAASPFQICSASTCTVPGEIQVSNIAAVIFSEGEDTSNSANQRENTDGDNNFVNAPESQLAGSAFDDRMKWISPNTLVLYLVKSGQLDGT